MSDVDWGKKFEEVDALWRMNYKAEGAHAKLTSGKHSDGYINCAKIVENPILVADVAAAVIKNLESKLKDKMPEYVIGPAYGAITFGHEVARQLCTKFGFTEVEYTDEGKMQILRRFDIPKDSQVLVIEDAITTGGSAQKTINVLEKEGINVLPFIGILLNWSGVSTLGDREIIALIETKMNVWDPEDCELCKKGSRALRPKYNWDKLAR